MYAANPSTAAVRAEMSAGRLVCISTPAQGNLIPDDSLVCLDNGVYGKGWPGENKWLAWVEKHRPIADRVLFVVAPDVVGNARATYDRSRPFLPVVRQMGFRVAYVAQNGQEDFTPPWSKFDCLFLGGSLECRSCGHVPPEPPRGRNPRCPLCSAALHEWKLGPEAAQLIREAKRRGKWVHAGRVNSARRFAHFELMGCDSADGTYIAFGPDVNLPTVLHWTQSLFGGAA